MAGLTITKIEPSDQFGAIAGEAITDIPEPSGYDWGKMDISGQEAGRRLTSDMWKNLKATARTLDLVWANRDASVISTALLAFEHEYMWITYFDALTGQNERKHFYGGDASASMYSFATPKGTVWSVAKKKLMQSITDKV